MYERLKCIKRRLSTREVASLSQKPGFSAQWRVLAEHLGLTDAEIERVRDSGHEDTERCYQLLLKWDQMKHQDATVTVLTEAIYRNQNTVMLEILHSAFCGR